MEPSGINNNTNNNAYDIKFLVWNSNGLRNKTHYLTYLIYKNSPDVIAVTETKLDHTVDSSEICQG